MDLPDFEAWLAKEIFPLRAHYVCQFSDRGPLVHYPSNEWATPGIDEISIHIFEPDSFFGDSLIPGAINTLHVHDSGTKFAVDILELALDNIFSQLTEAVHD